MSKHATKTNAAFSAVIEQGEQEILFARGLAHDAARAMRWFFPAPRPATPEKIPL